MVHYGDSVAFSLTAPDRGLIFPPGLEIVSRLCQLEENEVTLAESLTDETYEDICRLLSVCDIQLIVFTLEALYQLSELGEATTTGIASVKHAVGEETDLEGWLLWLLLHRFACGEMLSRVRRRPFLASVSVLPWCTERRLGSAAVLKVLYG